MSDSDNKKNDLGQSHADDRHTTREIQRDMEQFARKHPYRGRLYDIDADQARMKHESLHKTASSGPLRNAGEITADLDRHMDRNPIDPAVAAFRIDQEARMAIRETQKGAARRKRNRRFLIIAVSGAALLFMAWGLLNTVPGEFVLKRIFVPK